MKRKNKLIILVTFIALIILGIYLSWDKIIAYLHAFEKYKKITEENVTIEDLNIDKEEAFRELTSIDHNDIEYKNTNNIPLTLDIYGPKKIRRGGSPVLIYVHGGSWAYGSNAIPEFMEPILDFFREEGFTVISTEYQLMEDEVIFYKQVSDIKDTVRWINKNRDIYNFDTENVGIIGVSSGAHLAMMAAYSENEEFIDDTELEKYNSKIKYLIDFFGPTDLSTLDINNAGSTFEEIINSLGDKKEEIIQEYSPVNYVGADEPKTLIIHSTEDQLVPYENAESLFKKLIDTKNKAEIVTLEGTSHDFSEFNEENIKDVGINIFKFIIDNL
ncbi:MAG: alpha/beta hydrolase [Clostridiales bacterium]|nr:alpha/beta hydrolase [Clostridiales bacterium]